MSIQADRAIRDPETIAALAEDPALLAIVDALYCTQRRPVRAKRRAWPLLAAAALAAAVALALLTPWDSGPGLVPRALAAVGSEPVIHVVTEQSLTGTSVLDLRTGALTAATTRTEVYFDPSRRLERIVTSSPFSRAVVELDTATGDWIDGRRVFTCVWIAAHPVAAAAARVSCPAGSRSLPPTLDPALAAFASGYQAALRSGKARHIRDGVIGGRSVRWLAVGSREEVAIDAHSLLPVLVRIGKSRPVRSYRVLSFATEPFVASVFVRGRASTQPRPTGQIVRESRAVELAEARRMLGGTVIAPTAALGLRFASARVYKVLTVYDYGRPVRHSIETVLAYRSGARSVLLYEARMPDFVAGFTPTSSPVAGAALIRRGPILPRSAIDQVRAAKSGLPRAPWQATTGVGSIYVIVTAPSKTLLLSTVRALVPSKRGG